MFTITDLNVLFTSLYFPSFYPYDDTLRTIFLCLSSNLLYCSINFLLLVLLQFISGTVFVLFPILWLQSLLFLPQLILVFYYVPLFVTYTLFADQSQFVCFCILLPSMVKSHLSLYSFFCDTSLSYGIPLMIYIRAPIII